MGISSAMTPAADGSVVRGTAASVATEGTESGDVQGYAVCAPGDPRPSSSGEAPADLQHRCDLDGNSPVSVRTLRYVTDNMPLVIGMRKQRWKHVRGTNGDLWRLIRVEMQRLAGKVQVQLAFTHSHREEEEGEGSTVRTMEDVFTVAGNMAADAFAAEVAKRALARATCTPLTDAVDAISYLIRRRALRATMDCMLCDPMVRAKRASTAAGPQLRVSAATAAQRAIANSQHSIVRIGSKLMCTQCHSITLSRPAVAIKFAQSPCLCEPIRPPPPPDAEAGVATEGAGVGSAGDGTAASVWVGGEPLHHTHSLREVPDLCAWFCTNCGLYAALAARELREPCKPITPRGKLQLARLVRGRWPHPRGVPAEVRKLIDLRKAMAAGQSEQPVQRRASWPPTGRGFRRAPLVGPNPVGTASAAQGTDEGEPSAGAGGIPVSRAGERAASLPPPVRTTFADSDARLDALRRRIVAKELKAAKAARSEVTFRGPTNSAAERQEVLDVLDSHVTAGLGGPHGKRSAVDEKSSMHANADSFEVPTCMQLPGATHVAAAAFPGTDVSQYAHSVEGGTACNEASSSGVFPAPPTGGHQAGDTKAPDAEVVPSAGPSCGLGAPGDP